MAVNNGFGPGAHASSGASFVGDIDSSSHVVVENVFVRTGAQTYSVLAGFDAEHGVENVVIQGLSYQGRAITDQAGVKLETDYARGVVIR